MNKKIGLKPLPPPLVEPPRPASRSLQSAPQPPSFPLQSKPKDAATALQGVHHVKEQDELGKRRAAEERWDFENREINKKLSAVKSSGSRD